VAIEVQRVLEPRPRGVPCLPVVTVQLGPAVNAARVPEAQRSPGAPVDEVGAPEEAEVVDVEAGGLPDDAVSNRVMPPAYFPNFGCSACPEGGTRRVDLMVVTRLLVVVHELRCVGRSRPAIR
jgi:hypothetical protein